MIKSRGIIRKLLPLGIHLKHYSPIYEEKLLIKEIILFETVKKNYKKFNYYTITPPNPLCRCYFLCKWNFLCKWVLMWTVSTRAQWMIKINILKAFPYAIKWTVVVFAQNRKVFSYCFSVSLLDSSTQSEWTVSSFFYPYDVNGRWWKHSILSFVFSILCWHSQPSLHDYWVWDYQLLIIQ